MIIHIENSINPQNTPRTNKYILHGLRIHFQPTKVNCITIYHIRNLKI